MHMDSCTAGKPGWPALMTATASRSPSWGACVQARHTCPRAPPCLGSGLPTGTCRGNTRRTSRASAGKFSKFGDKPTGMFMYRLQLPSIVAAAAASQMRKTLTAAQACSKAAAAAGRPSSCASLTGPVGARTRCPPCTTAHTGNPAAAAAASCQLIAAEAIAQLPHPCAQHPVNPLPATLQQ
jgi:hypothetical protein